VPNAERHGVGIFHMNERERVLFKVTSDQRTTRPGRMLGKYSLGVLPQLLDVLSGEMSQVGPRPLLAGER